MRTCAVPLLLLLLTAPVHTAGQSSPVHDRRIGASATITGSPRLRDGQFQLTGRAAICGLVPREASFSGEAAFIIEVSGGTSGSMTSIAFSSKQLTTPAATAARFNLSVAVVTPNGGKPPQYVLNTDSPRQGNGGTATVTTTKGVTTLKVVGRNDASESIELVVTCG